MVVCKFFLQGNCKFGTYCNYEHQIPSKYSYTKQDNNAQSSTSILRQPTFGSQQTFPVGSSAASMDSNALIKATIQDMVGAEKGGQWLLSCYAPFKEKPAFPGFEDHSPEEVRLGFYEAVKNGTVEQYKQQLQEMAQETVQKVRALQNPSGEVMNILQGIYNSPAASFSGTYGQNTISTSVSGNSMFGANAAGTVFAQTPANGFGGAMPSQQSNNIFAQSSTNVFPPTTQSQNIFASAAPFHQQSRQIFPPAATPATANSFATPQAAFAPLTQGNIFAHASQTTNQFSQAAVPTQTSNTFPTSIQIQPSSQTASVNIFAPGSTPGQTNTFAPTPASQQNVFASSPFAQPPSAAPPSYSSSIFGSRAATGMGLGSSASQVNIQLYSKPEELSEQERRWFESGDLDIYNIPDKPPTYNMCFA